MADSTGARPPNSNSLPVPPAEQALHLHDQEELPAALLALPKETGGTMSVLPMVGHQPNDGEIRTGSYYRQHPGGASPGVSETVPPPQDLEAGKQRVPHQGDVQGLRKSDYRRGDHHQEGPPEGEGDSTASFPIQLLNTEAQSSVPGGSGGGVAGVPGFPTVATTAPSNVLATANSSIREDPVASGSHRGHRSNGVRSLDSFQEAPSGQRTTGSKNEPALISPGLRHNMVGHLKRNHGVWQELHALLTRTP